MAKKAAPAPKKTNRESDKFMLRLPPGMREAIAREAARSNRSMNAELIGRLDFSFENALTNKVLLSVSKDLADTADLLRSLLASDELDLHSFIADQRAKGVKLTQSEAIRLIVRTYLAEQGYLFSNVPPEQGKG
jgi:hypothetical protein